MIVQHSSRFKRELAKLSTKQKQDVTHALALFVINPFSPGLHNHKLKGNQQGLRAFSAGFDLRIVYREEGNHIIVLLLRVGTHEKVY